MPEAHSNNPRHVFNDDLTIPQLTSDTCLTMASHISGICMVFVRGMVFRSVWKKASVGLGSVWASTWARPAAAMTGDNTLDPWAQQLINCWLTLTASR